MDSVETGLFTITGLVDYNDEQGNIIGQYPIGSVQELPLEVGQREIEKGVAEAAEEVTVEEAPEAPEEATFAYSDPSEVPGADDDNRDLPEGHDPVDNDNEVE